MCLIRTRNELDEEVNIPARRISQRVPQQSRRSRSRQSRRRSRSRSSSSSSSSHHTRSQAASYPPAQFAYPPPPPRSVHESIEIDRRRVSEVPLAAAPTRSPRQSATVVTVHVDRSPRESRNDQVAVVRSREHREREDEGPSYRYVKPGRESMRSRREEEEERDYGRSGRRSGSLTYAVNPRTSTASHRSTRERIVVQDYDGRRREYYK